MSRCTLMHNFVITLHHIVTHHIAARTQVSQRHQLTSPITFSSGCLQLISCTNVHSTGWGWGRKGVKFSRNQQYSRSRHCVYLNLQLHRLKRLGAAFQSSFTSTEVSRYVSFRIILVALSPHLLRLELLDLRIWKNHPVSSGFSSWSFSLLSTTSTTLGAALHVDVYVLLLGFALVSSVFQSTFLESGLLEFRIWRKPSLCQVSGLWFIELVSLVHTELHCIRHRTTPSFGFYKSPLESHSHFVLRTIQ